MAEVTILGLGNLLWADEGFGVRAAEKLFEQYADNEKVDVVDGGTQGLALLPWLQQTEKLLIMDAIERRFLRASGVCVNITLTSNGLPMKLSLARSQRASGRRIRSRRLRQNCRHNRRD